MKAIVTMPPYAPYLEEVAQHPIVSGIRLNTVMPRANRGLIQSIPMAVKWILPAWLIQREESSV